MTRHFLYIVSCSDGTLYTGYTTNVARRVAEHNSGRGARYTRTRRPVKLVYQEERKSVRDALRREITIKEMGRSAKLRLCRRYLSEHGRSPS